MKTDKTLSDAILAVAKKNSRRGVTVPELVQKLEARFPMGLHGDGRGFDRQTVSGRVAKLYNNFFLDTAGSRTNPDTGRETLVYIP